MTSDPINKRSAQLDRIQKLFAQAQYSPAANLLAAALRQNPDDPELKLMGAKLNYIGGHFEAARADLIKIVPLLPFSIDAHHLLGVILSQTGENDAALQALERAHQMSPDDPQICSNLGAVISRQDSFNDAEPLLLKARNLDPKSADVRYNLGILYRAQLRHEESAQEFHQAVLLRPNHLEYRRSLIRALNYCLNTDSHRDFDVIRSTGGLIEKGTPLLFSSYSKANNRIRIGYIGSTLRKHSVAYFLLPILEKHSDQFEVFCYHIGELEDEITKCIAEKADHYRHVFKQNAESVARLIHQDGINILFELEGYTELDKALEILAYSPAPVQISWIGYPGTTGMSRIDYRIVDEFTDPQKSNADSLHTEKLIRMAAGFSVYSNPVDAPSVMTTPALRKGYITFGSFNWSIKIHQDVIELWANILRAVPESKLLLKHTSFERKSTQENMYSAFYNRGIANERILLAGFVQNSAEHLSRYHDIDIALDPFPYNGTTTSCEALWMGVPVVTLAGDKHISRVGISLMSNLGHPEWIADDYGEYVAIATELASDYRSLNTVRMGLREEMAKSPLMDNEAFVTEFEQRLMAIWRNRND